MGARSFAPAQTGPGAHPAAYTMDNGSFRGAKRLGRGVDHSHHLAPRLKKEQNYTSTPPLSLRGLLQAELYCPAWRGGRSGGGNGAAAPGGKVQGRPRLKCDGSSFGETDESI